MCAERAYLARLTIGDLPAETTLRPFTRIIPRQAVSRGFYRSHISSSFIVTDLLSVRGNKNVETIWDDSRSGQTRSLPKSN